MGGRVVRGAGDRGARHRPRRPRHLPRARPAGRLPDRLAEALRRRRPRVRAPPGAGGDRVARRARRGRETIEGLTGVWTEGEPAVWVPARAGAQDRLDRRPRQPRRHHPRPRDQRQQRPAAVRVGRALRDRGLPGHLARAASSAPSRTSTPSPARVAARYGEVFERDRRSRPTCRADLELDDR